MLPKVPTNTRELEEGFENLKKDVTLTTEKAVTGVAKDVTGQISPTEFVSALYAPSAKKPEAGSGETASVAEQLSPKPGELFGNIAGSPLEPGQQEQTESALSQVSIPVDKLASTMIGSQIEPGENPPSEDPLEQLLPTSNQVGAWVTGSVPTQRVTPHMETAGQQIVPSVDELTGILGITPAESGQGGAAQRQAPPAENPTPAGSENMQGQPPEVQQMQQQQKQQAELDRASVDPTMQMSSEERMKYTEEQKAKREQMMLHDREYRKFGTPLDPIGSLEEQVAKVRQQKQQEEEQQKQEEEQRKQEEEERQKQEAQELPEPSTKPKPGDPNIAVGQSQKKTEIHRGAAG